MFLERDGILKSYDKINNLILKELIDHNNLILKELIDHL